MFDSKIRAQTVIFYVKFEYILVYRPSFRHNIELYMQNHDIRALTTFENSPRIYERFVDDIVSIIKRENLERDVDFGYVNFTIA